MGADGLLTPGVSVSSGAIGQDRRMAAPRLPRRTLGALAPILLAAALAVASPPASADDHRYEDDDDHERARAALQEGAVLPLADILARLGRQVGGRVIAIEIERDDGRWVYEITAVTPSGRVRELAVDAATARVLELEEDDD